MAFDLLIQGARVLPSEGPARRTAVGISDARIAAVLNKIPYRVSSAAVRRLTGLNRWKP